MQEEERI